MKKGQTWSTDAIVATTLVLIVSIAILFLFENLGKSKKFESLVSEGELVSESLTRPDAPGFVVDSKLNKELLQQFANRSYSDLKSLFGLQADFCIHLEDEEGNLINISRNITGIGSHRAKVNGVECVTLDEKSVCGDLSCSGSETCASCPADCACSALDCQVINGACASGADGIFSMFSDVNSHAGIYGTYGWNVCCSVPGCNINCRNANSCNSDENLIVSLYASTNSHVSESGYNTNVCCKLTACQQNFDTCKFYYQGGSGGCEEGYECLASAASTSNSHVAACDTYNYNICCSII